MSYSAITQPHTYVNGYSFIPLRIEDTTVGSVNSYQYIVNILYKERTFSTTSTVSYEGNVFTEVTFTEDHPFNRGDILFVSDSTGTYTNYYTVMSVVDSSKVIIDLEVGQAISGTLTASNVLKYKVAPNPDGEIKLDLSNTIKDFVSQDLEDSNDIYLAPNTYFDYNLKCGHEGTALFDFEDNRFESGNVGFVNSTLTATTQVDFEIGDQIIIQQDLYSWDYDDNYFSSGNVGFTGSTSHIFESGDTVTITGQITNPSYNGVTTITSVDTNSIVTDKPWGSNTPVEPGTIYGVPVPEYNTTATITNIYYSAGTGVVIVTDVGFQTSTPAIGGTIKHADGKIITDYNELNITGLTAYNSYVNQLNYSIDEFDKYVCQDRASSENNISTIFGNTKRYRIEPSTKSWLLAHTSGGMWEPRLTFYDASGTFLSQYKLDYPYTYGPTVNINTYINNGGDVRLDGTSAHGASVGDFVEIVGGPYAGIAEVTQVNSSTDVTVDVTFTTGLPVGGETFKVIENHSSKYDYYFPVGVDQIDNASNKTLLSGSSISSIKSQIEYYDVNLEYEGAVNTNTITFEINDDCSRYELYHIMWKDARGSWISYPFKYVSQDTIDVDRKNYYQTEGTWSSNSFGFDSFGRGEKTFFARSRKKVRVTSGWIEQFENDLLVDMMKSAAVYVQLPTGEVIACTLEDDDITPGKNINEQIWNYTFTVVYSNDEIRL